MSPPSFWPELPSYALYVERITPGPACSGERVHFLDGDLQCSIERQRALLDTLLQSVPLQGIP